MMSLIVVLVFSALIGFFAQITGLCMVRGVGDWMDGKPIRLLAILSTGFWVYLFFPLMDPVDIPLHLQPYKLHWGFLLGGFVFGIGTAVNGACSISTVCRLSSGDFRMMLTIFGWLGGWLLLEYSGIRFGYSRLATMNSWLPWLSWAVLAFLLLASAYVYFKHRKVWRIWSGIMLVGILAGAVFLLQPAWSPSDFVKDLGLATVTRNPDQLPAVERIAILALMLIGMGIGAWRYRRFRFVVPGTKQIGKHLFAGLLMGVGAAAALGGNDFQLLLAMPALSLAGLLAVSGILLGIRFGMVFISDKVDSPMSRSKRRSGPRYYHKFLPVKNSKDGDSSL